MYIVCVLRKLTAWFEYMSYVRIVSSPCPLNSHSALLANIAEYLIPNDAMGKLPEIIARLGSSLILLFYSLISDSVPMVPFGTTVTWLVGHLQKRKKIN